MKKKCILWKEKYDKIKFTILLLLVGINVGFASEAYSQSTLLSLNVNKGTVKEVFAAIEKQSEYVFFYYDNVLDINRRVNIKAENKTVDEILKQVFAGTDNSYVIKDRQIFISKSEKKDTVVPGVTQEGKKMFRGKVMDDLGEPLPGATVVVVGSTRGVTTDLDGTFEIDVTAADKLKISFLGLGDKIITVGNQQNIALPICYLYFRCGCSRLWPPEKGKCSWCYLNCGCSCVESSRCFTFYFSGWAVGWCGFHVTFW